MDNVSVVFIAFKQLQNYIESKRGVNENVH